MSIIAFLLLSFLCLGIANADPDHEISSSKAEVIGDEANHARTSDGSQIIAEAFVEALSTYISSNNKVKLSELVSDKFKFRVCKARYNKKQLLAFFDLLPVNSKLSLLFQSSEWIRKDKNIKLNILVTGFGNSEFQAELVIQQEKEKYVLIGGKIPKCESFRFP